MYNPFIRMTDGEESYVGPICSINRLRLAKLPIYGLDDSIEGKTALEIFSTGTLIREIKGSRISHYINLGELPDIDLPRFLVDWINDKNPDVACTATGLMTKFGTRLGLILLALKLGEKENRDARPEWTDEHWEYWKNLKTIILVGGLANGVQGRLLRREVDSVFTRAGVPSYNICIFENAAHAGVFGCIKKLKKRTGTSIVFDFGQTNIKRSKVKLVDGEIVSLKALPTLPSLNMLENSGDAESDRRSAIELHRYLIKTIAKTFEESSRRSPLNDEIVISIANYVNGDCLNPGRGGYAKLAMLDDNYTRLLQHDISGELRRQVKVRLIHDGTAIAQWFSDFKDAVCISIGTAFGIGFPDLELD